jgi:hypothetical protein
MYTVAALKGFVVSPRGENGPMFVTGGNGDVLDVSSAGVAEVGAWLSELVAGLNPDAVPLPDAPAVWRGFDQIARLASGAALLMTRRVDESRAWAREGHRTPEDYLAFESGGSVGDARSQLKTAEQLKAASATEDALKAGQLSKDQAQAIADAAAANPAAEGRLLDGAADKPLKELKDQAGREKAAADPDPDARERRHHTNRSIRTWTGSDGGFQIRGNGTIASGGRLLEALNPIVDDIIGERKKTGNRESRAAYLYDALLRLADQSLGAPSATPEDPDDTSGTTGTRGGSSTPKVRHRAILHLDVEALRRGHVEGDELCEIAGLGQIPIRTAINMLSESTLHLILTNGVDVANVTYLGRGVNAAQKVALDWTQHLCSNSKCTGNWLQDDHRDDYAGNRQTRLDNIDRLCPHCHRLKTYKSWKLVQGTGRRPLVPPTDPRHPNNSPP